MHAKAMPSYLPKPRHARDACELCQASEGWVSWVMAGGTPTITQYLPQTGISTRTYPHQTSHNAAHTHAHQLSRKLPKPAHTNCPELWEKQTAGPVMAHAPHRMALACMRPPSPPWAASASMAGGPSTPPARMINTKPILRTMNAARRSPPALTPQHPAAISADPLVLASLAFADARSSDGSRF